MLPLSHFFLRLVLINFMSVMSSFTCLLKHFVSLHETVITIAYLLLLL